MIVFFYVFALASLLLALGVLVFKNPIHSALSLVGTLAGTLLPGESSDSGRSLVDLRTASA
jgi:hypothetical protein